MEKKSIREIISVIFKAVTLAMGVSVVVLSSLMMLGAVIPYFVPAPFSFGFSFLPSFWMGKGALEGRLLYLLPSVAAAGLWVAALWMRSYRVCR